MLSTQKLIPYLVRKEVHKESHPTPRLGGLPRTPSQLTLFQLLYLDDSLFGEFHNLAGSNQHSFRTAILLTTTLVSFYFFRSCARLGIVCIRMTVGRTSSLRRGIIPATASRTDKAERLQCLGSKNTGMEAHSRPLPAKGELHTVSRGRVSVQVVSWRDKPTLSF